ncbi:hypothetical protein BURK2_00751 [Burkholderiales bacterium]|nr:hypothetical protein BURK2_00751 [Burkholderiales bacterium]
MPCQAKHSKRPACTSVPRRGRVQTKGSRRAHNCRSRGKIDGPYFGQLQPCEFATHRPSSSPPDRRRDPLPYRGRHHGFDGELRDLLRLARHRLLGQSLHLQRDADRQRYGAGQFWREFWRELHAQGFAGHHPQLALMAPSRAGGCVGSGMLGTGHFLPPDPDPAQLGLRARANPQARSSIWARALERLSLACSSSPSPNNPEV